jgi:hypothetical protein
MTTKTSEIAQSEINGANQRASAGKNTTMGIRTENRIKLAAIRAAKADRRSLSSLCEKIMANYLLSRGYLTLSARGHPPEQISATQQHIEEKPPADQRYIEGKYRGPTPGPSV